jgi:hypothetical protein
MPRKNLVLSDRDIELLDRLQRSLGWSHGDSVRFGIAALSALLIEGHEARQAMDDGRQVIRLRLGDGRSVRLRERKDDSGAFYISTESGPAVWAREDTEADTA